MTVLINILLGFYVFVALLMILVILMQRPKSEGLGAAFGGGVTENIFGAQTTNVLTKITSWLAAIFFLMTFGLSILYAQKAGAPSTLKTDLMKGEPTPAPDSTPGATPAGAAASTSATPAASQSPEPSSASTATPSAETPTPAATATPVPATPAPQPTVAATPAPEPTVSAADSSAASATPSTHRRRRHR